MDYTVEPYAGSHRDLEWSFLEADDSPELLDGYLDLGRVWVARGADQEVIGHLQAIPRSADVWEVTNTAVVESHRDRGVGRALMERVTDAARSAGVSRVTSATGAADIGNLRFYQRLGFRMTHVVPDVFTPAHGYPAGLEVDGIPLLDQVWFELVL